jgi:hypothetical protein
MRLWPSLLPSALLVDCCDGNVGSVGLPYKGDAETVPVPPAEAAEFADKVGTTIESVELMDFIPCAISEVGRLAGWL